MTVSALQGKIVLQGMDVSYAQGNIDWNKVVNSKLIDFAFCKATEGTGHKDVQFQKNWDAMKAHGMIRGAYHFGRPNVDAVAQAKYFVSVVGPLEPTDMLVLDIEAGDLIGSKFTDWNLAFLETVEKLSGATPIIYTGGPFFDSHDGTPDLSVIKRLAHFPLWLAAYTVNPEKYIPPEWKSLGWVFWQRSGDVAAPGDTTLQVPGINGNVDRDNFIGTLEDLKKFAGSLHLKKEPEVEPVPEPMPDPIIVEPAPSNTKPNILSLILQFLSMLFKRK